MARKALYGHATQVNTNTYPDDGSSPVGSNEWNEDPDPNGMLGFTPQTSTVTISSGALTPTDSITVVASESSTSDTITSIALTNTNQYDLLYLFADTGDTITLTNTSSPSSNGQVKTVSNANETLSETSPTILIRKGNYWYGYGGGVVNAVSDIGDVTISSVGSGELLKWNGSAWINQTLAESGIQATLSNSDIATAVEAASDSNTFTDADHSKLNAIEASATADQSNAEIVAAVEAGTDSNTFTDADHSKLNAIEASATADQSNAEIVAAVEAGSDSNTFTDADHSKLDGIAASANNYTHTTNANLTGDVTSSGNATTIANDAVSLAKMAGLARGKLIYGDSSGNPAALAVGTANQVLTHDGTDFAWQNASGGSISGDQDYSGAHDIVDLQRLCLEIQGSSFDSDGTNNNDRTGEAELYVRTIDSNNDGLFIRIKKNGSNTYLQIA